MSTQDVFLFGFDIGRMNSKSTDNWYEPLMGTYSSY